MLSKEQQDTITEIVSFFIDDSKRFLILDAIAGAGKTTILKEVEKQYNYLTVNNVMFDKYTIFYLAPTHKACQVLRDNGLDSHTLHSYVYHVADCHEHIAVVDEYSFIDLNLFNRLLAKGNHKVLFIGDKYQLPPVSANYSPVNFYGFDEISLTESHRLKPDVLQYAYHLRECIDRGIGFTKPIESTYIKYIGLNELRDTFLQTNNSHVLCLRNSSVNKMNKLIAQRSKICDGDMVYLTKGNSLEVSTPYRVIHIKDGMYKDVPIYEYTLSKVVDGTRYLTHRIVTKFKKDREAVNLHDDVVLTYGLTVHKSQGSTFDSVFVYLDDFMSVKDVEIRNKLFYTAITRSRGYVYVISCR